LAFSLHFNIDKDGILIPKFSNLLLSLQKSKLKIKNDRLFKGFFFNVFSKPALASLQLATTLFAQIPINKLGKTYAKYYLGDFLQGWHVRADRYGLEDVFGLLVS